MPTYSARDAAKNFGAVLSAADEGAVVVRRYGRPRAAVVGWRLYNAYRKAYEEKVAAHLAAKLEAELRALGEGAPASGERKRVEALLALVRDLARSTDAADDAANDGAGV